MPDSKQTQRTPQCNRAPKPVSAGVSGASDESAVEADGGDERKRNLPITVSAFISALTTICCLTIRFGNVQPTAVPALIILSSWAVLVFSILLVKTINNLDNAMYRPKGF